MTGPAARAAVAANAADARIEEDFPEIDAAVLSVPEATNGISGEALEGKMVSGVAALLASQNRSVAQIRRRIQSTATDIGPLGRDNLFGTGLVNARAAVDNSLSSEPADADRVPTTPSKR